MNPIHLDIDHVVPRIAGMQYEGPSMLTTEEKAFYFLLGSKVFSMQGVVVDAGCWLGSSTFFVARGIEQNLNFDGRTLVYACDLFRWHQTHDQQVFGYDIALVEGEDFKFQTDHYLKSVAAIAKTVRMDYSESPSHIQYHPSGESIEVLLVDAGKTPDLLINILEGYLPYCIEHTSIIFFQDYRDYFCWFTVPILSYLSDFLEPFIYLRNGGVGFRFLTKENIGEKIAEAREMFNKPDLLTTYFDKGIAQIGEDHCEAYFQIRANKIALFLYSRERLAPNSSEAHELMEYVSKLDKNWPIHLNDSPLQNAYCRLQHALTGVKDLTLRFKSLHYYKRRLLNPRYAARTIKNLLK